MNEQGKPLSDNEFGKAILDDVQNFEDDVRAKIADMTDKMRQQNKEMTAMVAGIKDLQSSPL